MNATLKRLLTLGTLSAWMLFITISLLAPASVYQQAPREVAQLYSLARQTHVLCPWWEVSLMLHILYFSGAMALGALALAAHQRTTPWALLAAAAVITVYGLLIEILQEHCISGRAFEVRDLVANAVGTVIPCLLALYMPLFSHCATKSAQHTD